jgi:hypothetical protein
MCQIGTGQQVAQIHDGYMMLMMMMMMMKVTIIIVVIIFLFVGIYMVT